MRLLFIALYPLLCLLGGCISAHAQVQFPVVDPYRFNASFCATCSQYTTAFNVKLTGGLGLANDSTAFAGLADSKVLTVSFWIQTTDTQGAILYICSGGGAEDHLILEMKNGGTVQINAKNSSNSTIAQGSTDSATVNDGNWHHVLIAFDLTDSAKRKFYIDGSSVAATWSTYTNDTMDLSPSSPLRGVFNNPDEANNPLSGFLAELWIDDSYNDDPCLFYCNGRPATIGATGQLANGAAPAAYYSKVGDDLSWFTDSSINGSTNTFGFVSGTRSHTSSP